MGVDATGTMEIPQSPSTVAWYGFTATPGTSGNAVMAGHVTWGGARAVFNQLQALRSGDTIEVQTGEGGIRYVVQRTYLVRPEQADIATIIGPRDGPQTLTLITCGGTFDSAAREYDHRVIVFATRV
jgi:LPXTG-site transpeptidase (sortase) family protein